MSYGRSSKKEYEQPSPCTGSKGKPNIRRKGSFEKQMIEKASQDVKAADSSAE
jgi:hypothetical protein